MAGSLVQQVYGRNNSVRKYFSTFSIARLLKVDPGSIANWIDQGRLKAHRTPGGHRRVTNADLREFLQKQEIPLPPEIDNRASCVLLVEEDRAIAEEICAQIQKAHPACQVMHARSAFLAGEAIATHPVNVMIIDLKTAGIDGIEICKHVKSQPPTCHIQIVGLAGAEDQPEAMVKSGAKACLATPLDMPQLLAEIATCLKT